MDFSHVLPDPELRTFMEEVEAFIEQHVTVEVLEQERLSGSGFNEALHLALGRRGWVAPDWPSSEGGAGLDPIRCHVLRQALAYSGAPQILHSTTLLPPISIRKYGSDWQRANILPAVGAGTVRICLGYTEPDTGSDLAAVRTRATRDGSDWIVSGQKMFTTGVQHSQYCFLLARSDPEVPKHRGLTVFLVPLESSGIQVTPIHTFGGERTNLVFYDEVRVSEKFMVGEEGQGWSVITTGALGAEHGLDGRGQQFEGSTESYSRTLRRALVAATEWAYTENATGCRPMDNVAVRERLAEVAIGVEACSVTSGPHGRVLSSDLLIRYASDLLDLVGSPGLLSHSAEGAVADGFLEFCHRYAQGTATYGGTVEIHRNMIAERFLGLPRSTPRSSQ